MCVLNPDGTGGRGAVSPTGIGGTGDAATTASTGGQVGPSNSGGSSSCLDAGKQGLIGQGQSCGCDTDCSTGFCANGVCCDTQCSGTCMACDLLGSKGICSAVPAGVAPHTAGQCVATDPTTCGQNGMCDGKGSCQKFVGGTRCREGVCSADGSALTNVRICDGTGNCVRRPDEICDPYLCTSNACTTTCSFDKDCAPNRRCKDDNTCGPFPIGRGPCTAATAAVVCQSGFCADGVCCNVACEGECVSCNQPSAPGLCEPVGEGLPHYLCKIEPEASCGQTGVCDFGGSCAYYPPDTICVPASCSGGNMLITAATCDGQGGCQAPGLVSCAPFTCSDNECRTH